MVIFNLRYMKIRKRKNPLTIFGRRIWCQASILPYCKLWRHWAIGKSTTQQGVCNYRTGSPHSRYWDGDPQGTTGVHQWAGSILRKYCAPLLGCGTEVQSRHTWIHWRHCQILVDSHGRCEGVPRAPSPDQEKKNWNLKAMNNCRPINFVDCWNNFNCIANWWRNS